MISKILKNRPNKKIKLAFVSHPISDDYEGNFKKIDKICKELLKEGYLPISPGHLFSFMTDENHRKMILWVCSLLIFFCDVVFIFGVSEGTMFEKKVAEKLNKEIILKYEEHSK